MKIWNFFLRLCVKQKRWMMAPPWLCCMPHTAIKSCEFNSYNLVSIPILQRKDFHLNHYIQHTSLFVHWSCCGMVGYISFVNQERKLFNLPV